MAPKAAKSAAPVAEAAPSVHPDGMPAIEFPSLAEIKSHLPDELFESSALRSLAYVAFDTAVIAALFLGQLALHKSAFFWYAYPVYAFMQGTMFWAYFVLGHDCGHSSFSSSSVLNDIVGNILHSFILVPYYPWMLSHRHHHRNTGNIDKEEVFHPLRKRHAPTAVVPRMFRSKSYFMLGLGWFSYLFIGYGENFLTNHVEKSQGVLPSNAHVKSHFSLRHRLFEQHQTSVLISLICWYAMAASLVAACFQYGLLNVTLYYFVPLFVFATWITVVTFLHHHDPDVDLPWYGDSVWNYVKGNLSSVDRSYGVLHWLIHNIGTHQVHHLFPKIPQYKLIEATEAFHAAYPHFTRECNKSIVPAFIQAFQSYADQHVISNESQYHLYRPAGSVQKAD